jgi:hypothetical protein
LARLTQDPPEQVLQLPQTRPQAPQLLPSVLKARQTPLQQVWPAAQALPQAPQLASSDVRFLQPLLQQVVPEAHPVPPPHVPVALHFSAVVQALPSLQAVPVALSVYAQAPVVVLQVPAAL